MGYPRIYVLHPSDPNLKPVPRPLVENKKVPHEQLIAGFVSGEGCLKVIVAKASNNKVGFRVLIGFQVYQHMPPTAEHGT